MNECCTVTRIADRQRPVFVIVLSINVAMFLFEAVAGLISHSTALLADSVDMLGDAIVYGFSLYVIGKSAIWHAGDAFLKGVIMAAIGLAILAQVVFKVLHGITPAADVIGLVGVIALAANLFVLWSSGSEEGTTSTCDPHGRVRATMS